MESNALIEMMLAHSRNQDSYVEEFESGAKKSSESLRQTDERISDDVAQDITGSKRRRLSAYESEDEDGEGDGEGDGDGDDDLAADSGSRINDEERIQRCRERNRVHARNTRERKRAQMDFLQQRIQDLSEEKYRLESVEPDTSVASILMSLSSASYRDGDVKPLDTLACAASHSTSHAAAAAAAAQKFASMTMERIKNEISATLSDDEELEMNSELLSKDRSVCSTQELEMIRRERNRMHAKKTRLRKKKMLAEMEAIIYGLEEDIRRLRSQRDSTGGAHANGRAHSGGSNHSTDNSSANSRISQAISSNGKFTGFRHANRMLDTGHAARFPQREAAAVAAAAAAAVSPSPARQYPTSPSSLSATVGPISAGSEAEAPFAARHSGELPQSIINLPPMFRSVPGIQEALLEYERQLLIDMQQKLMHNQVQAPKRVLSTGSLRSLHNPDSVLCNSTSSTTSSMSAGTTHESCLGDDHDPTVSAAAAAAAGADVNRRKSSSGSGYSGGSETIPDDHHK